MDTENKTNEEKLIELLGKKDKTPEDLFDISSIYLDSYFHNETDERNIKYYKEAVSFMEQSAALNYEPAYLSLAFLYKNAPYAIHSRAELIKQYLIKSADSGNKDGMYELAKVYESEGKYDKAYNLLEKAAEGNDFNDKAAERLGDIYHFDTEYNKKSNIELAVKYYEKAAEKFNKNALHALAFFNYMIFKDWKKTYKYARKGLDYNANGYCAMFIGFLFYFGHLFECDKKRAYDFFRMALANEPDCINFIVKQGVNVKPLLTSLLKQENKNDYIS